MGFVYVAIVLAAVCIAVLLAILNELRASSSRTEKLGERLTAELVRALGKAGEEQIEAIEGVSETIEANGEAQIENRNELVFRSIDALGSILDEGQRRRVASTGVANDTVEGEEEPVSGPQEVPPGEETPDE